MPKVKSYSIDPREKRRIVSDLFELIVSLRNKEETVEFLIGLLTPSEILMIARRIQIAKMLLEEDNYEVIRKKLKVSHQTINKVEHWLRGDEKKSHSIQSKIEKIKNAKREYRAPKSSNLLDCYAHHRFLKELLG